MGVSITDEMMGRMLIELGKEFRPDLFIKLFETTMYASLLEWFS